MESMILPSHAQIAQIDDVSRFMGPWAAWASRPRHGHLRELSFRVLSTEIRDGNALER